MKKTCLLFFIIFLFTPIQLFAVSPESLKKYPYQLITNDYEILNEANLKKYADDIISKSFDWDITGFDYWQCFPTKNVFVWKRNYRTWMDIRKFKNKKRMRLLFLGMV